MDDGVRQPNRGLLERVVKVRAILTAYRFRVPACEVGNSLRARANLGVPLTILSAAAIVIAVAPLAVLIGVEDAIVRYYGLAGCRVVEVIAALQVLVLATVVGEAGLGGGDLPGDGGEGVEDCSAGG